MHIKHIEVSNFRKLKAVRIDFSETNTVFVGANNSGKTSAMVALRRFLVDRSDFTINDFTLTHWAKIDAAAAQCEAVASGDPVDLLDWDNFLPFLDVWLNVPTQELHYVQKLLTLDWGTSIGVRLRFEPKDRQALQQEYLTAKKAAAVMSNADNGASPAKATSSTFALWPQSMMDFLSRRLRSTFEIRAYLLDPAALKTPENGLARPQLLPAQSDPIDGDPFQGLIQIDEIPAQRGFGKIGSTRSDDAQEHQTQQRGGKTLSNQLRDYYAKHLDPFDKPESQDIEALQALHEAQTAFGQRLAIASPALSKNSRILDIQASPILS